jgi:hypothetical protein
MDGALIFVVKESCRHRELLSMQMVIFDLTRIWLSGELLPMFSRPVRLAYQRPTSSTFLSLQISHQQPVNNIFLSEQMSTSHQPNEQTIVEIAINLFIYNNNIGETHYTSWINFSQHARGSRYHPLDLLSTCKLFTSPSSSVGVLYCRQ